MSAKEKCINRRKTLGTPAGVSDGHTAGQTGVYRPVSQQCLVVCDVIFSYVPFLLLVSFTNGSLELKIWQCRSGLEAKFGVGPSKFSSSLLEINPASPRRRTIFCRVARRSQTITYSHKSQKLHFHTLKLHKLRFFRVVPGKCPSFPEISGLQSPFKIATHNSPKCFL